MKVAIFGSRGYPSTYSGYETLVRRIAPYLRDRGHDISIYNREPGRVAWRRRVDQVDGIERIWTAGIDSKSLSTLSHGLTGALDARSRRFDAVLAVNVANGLYVPLLKSGRTRVAVHVDGLEWERAKWNRAGKALFRAGARVSARSADVLVADSHEIGHYWSSTFGRETTYIAYGADVHEDVSSDRIKALGLQSGGFVLHVARLVPENNTELLLDALDLLGPNVPAVVVGSAVGRSDLESRLRVRAQKYDDFQWLGHVSDQELLTQLWAHCGFYWHGHSVGGTNPSLLQALGCGAPVVALDTVYNREVITDEEQLCPSDRHELAERIKHGLGNGGLRAEWSSHGRSIVALRFRWDDVCRDYERLLEALAVAS